MRGPASAADYPDDQDDWEDDEDEEEEDEEEDDDDDDDVETWQVGGSRGAARGLPPGRAGRDQFLAYPSLVP